MLGLYGDIFFLIAESVTIFGCFETEVNFKTVIVYKIKVSFQLLGK